ncbi:HAD-IIIA family hydrolase [Frigidibacter sp. MR17.24]|uniref:HAD-IIIA family hydrolase n=1 Tax=Frigidibacter sp. MR17.24 TaxID=3127345 RepID=UPI003012EC7A
MLTQAVILCGGLGTRLGHLTSQTPKPMLPVAGAPFLDIIIQETARYGFEEIVLLAGRFGEQIVARYDGTTRWGAKLKVLVEPAPLGTGGALRFALEQLQGEFLLTNGDSWLDTDLARHAAAWAASAGQGWTAQMLLQHMPDVARYGVVDTDGPRVTAFREKDPSFAGRPGWINSGIYILRREIVAGLEPGAVLSLEADLLPAQVAEGTVRAEHAREGSYFIDIGLPETFERAQTELPRHRRKPALFLDRDGTLNRDVGYTWRPETLEWMPGAREAIARANAAGYYVFVVTNQAGVARGYYPEAAVLGFHRAMQCDLAALGAHIDAIEWCPHHPDGVVEGYARACHRRKPNPGMITDLLAQWPVAAERSFLVGDAVTDVAAAEAAGLRGLRYEGGSLDALVAAQLTEMEN